MTEIFTKLLDNFTFGKLMTDLLSGTVLAIALTLSFALATGTHLFPMEQAVHLNRRVCYFHEREDSARDALQKAAASCPRVLAPSETLDEALLICVNGLLRDKASARKERNDALKVLKDEYTAARTASEGPEKAFQEARDLAKNVLVFAEVKFLGLLLSLGTICGVLVSHFGRLALIRGLYRLRLPKQLDGPGGKEFKTADAREINDYVVTHYYRYAEGAANLGPALIALGWSLCRFLRTRLLMTDGLWIPVALVSAGVMLVLAGWRAYLIYRQQVAHAFA